MRSSFVATTGLKLVRTPSARRQAVRRRMVIAGAVAVFALASGAIGYLTAPQGAPDEAARTGPFSYFPSE
ncbi:MAG: hypothetical protein JNK30_09570 [Phenylobacterium sp.]|uniref:hypothetical protein n=1 Tax=Phenylobacterium sp. TaxID=1871053 RepID=UPI001A50FCC4|nr:hypothetical protein [Phenylobacterium sp.]MBL8771617.1 hypothetical protein [Phenylobacterium sp.]